jgi:hypothetical protein
LIALRAREPLIWNSDKKQSIKCLRTLQSIKQTTNHHEFVKRLNAQDIEAGI